MKLILIVDDLAENRYLLEKLLQGSGYRTLSASNGAEALAAALKDPPDIVITDILMPVMDGFAFCREWTKNATTGRIPLVFYTATYTDQKDEALALSLGAARFIVKPMENAVFLGIIKTVLTEFEKGRVEIKGSPAPDEQLFLKEYNATLVRKLENKMTQVEAAEKELRRTNAALTLDIERRQMAEERLRKSEETFRNLFEHSPIGKSMTGTDGTMRVNEAFCDTVGYSAEELRAKKWQEITHPDDVRRINDISRSLLDGTMKRAHYEQRFIHRDGNIVWTDVSSYLQREVNGEPQHFITSIVDITERIRADMELLDEKNKLTQLFDVSLTVAGSGTTQEMIDRTMRGLAELKVFRRMVIVIGDEPEGPRKFSHFGLSDDDLALFRKTPPVPPRALKDLLDQKHRISNSYYLPVAEQRSPRTFPLTPLAAAVNRGDWSAGDSLVIPMTAKGKTIGYLALFDPTDGAVPTLEKVRLLELYANQAATAVENLWLYDDLEVSYHDTLLAFVAAMEAKDPYTKGHSENVQRYALRLAERLGLPGDRIKVIDYSALLHDIGKLGVKEIILVKPSALTDTEYEEIKKHPLIGSNMVSSIENLMETAPIIKAHHEYFDGGGYPHGARGTEIPLESRIISVADAFEAMTSDRPYRKAFSQTEALHRLQAAAGKQFDAEIVSVFLTMIQ